MKHLKIKKSTDRIDFNCCDHSGKRAKYFLGYTGLKCCAVAMCLDCERTQFIGNWFSRIIYPIAKKLARNRVEVLKTIWIKPEFDETWQNELERYGRDMQ